MEFYEFCAKLDEQVHRQRCGQVAYNYLALIRPDLIDQVKNAGHDPYYYSSTTDEKWKSFIKFVKENW